MIQEQMDNDEDERMNGLNVSNINNGYRMNLSNLITKEMSMSDQCFMDLITNDDSNSNDHHPHQFTGKGNASSIGHDQVYVNSLKSNHHNVDSYPHDSPDNNGKALRRICVRSAVPSSSNSIISPTGLQGHIKSLEQRHFGSNSIIFRAYTAQSMFNRFRWYHITASLTNRNGTPALVPTHVSFDETIRFYDRRRRHVMIPHQGNYIKINLVGECSKTKRLIIKCGQCKKRDKSVIVRKRNNSDWSQSDEINNAQLIQALQTRDEAVSRDGKVQFHIRVNCCVGVHKQHHLNHVSISKLRIRHQDCPGLSMTMYLYIYNHNQVVCILSTSLPPIRILGKVRQSEMNCENGKNLCIQDMDHSIINSYRHPVELSPS